MEGAKRPWLIQTAPMPELPEVETVRRLLERLFLGRKLDSVEALPDSIVYESASHLQVKESILGRKVTGTGRKGKLFWMDFDDSPSLMMHLGMSGWVMDLTAESEKRLVSHGKAPLLDEEGRPRFLKLLWTAEEAKAAFTDGRRLARIWLGDPGTDKRVLGMGPDTLLDPLSVSDLNRMLQGRTAPIKALLLDQRLFCGVGNWVADEALFASGIAPQRQGTSLDSQELKRLEEALAYVLKKAVEAEADESRYPQNWLFHVRWGGSRGEAYHQGLEIRRDQVGGRTTAWAPDIQK